VRVIESISDMKRTRREMSGTVGFFPTMGYLHEGHLEGVRRVKSENTNAVVSIFVNPAQFGPSEDYTSYPRDIPRDVAMLSSAGADVIFIPPVAEMYSTLYSSWIDVEKITGGLEGFSRPGHFRGVATVCNKLFNIVEPTRAYFGQKDAQQCAVIRRMVADLNMNLEVVVVPTVREPDGLAMSSRNTYLKPEERKAATVLYRSLNLAKEMWEKGEKDAQRIRTAMIDTIRGEPLAEKIDYVSIANLETLQEMDEIKPPALVSLAVKIGKPRLLDNIILD
jgi:pantoate--beta-alanine ligase